MKFVIAKNGRVMGVANYLDEAQHFAERMAGHPERVTWSPVGTMFVGAEVSGWKILKPAPVDAK